MIFRQNNQTNKQTKICTTYWYGMLCVWSSKKVKWYGFFALGLIWVTWGVIRMIWVFRPRADMGFGYFKSDVVLIRARRYCLYHTCKKNVFCSKYMIRCDIHHRIPILNTCHISHYETKSNRIWAFWKSIPIRFSNLTEFSDHLTNFITIKILTDFSPQLMACMKSPWSVLVFSGWYHIIFNASIVNNCIIVCPQYEDIRYRLSYFPENMSLNEPLHEIMVLIT